MLGVTDVGDGLRFSGAEDMGGYIPHAKDAYTTHWVWKCLKDFRLSGYSLVRVKDHNVHKAGFKKRGGKSILMYTGYCEGVVAIHTWIWFANLVFELNKK